MGLSSHQSAILHTPLRNPQTRADIYEISKVDAYNARAETMDRQQEKRGIKNILQSLFKTLHLTK